MEFNVENLIAGLKSIILTAFPKKCSVCGKIYIKFEQFVKDTSSVENRNGIIDDYNKGGLPVVCLFRNCTCGSTLIVVCENRRDLKANGDPRKRFGKLMEVLTNKGIDENRARSEIIKHLKGQPSTLVDQLSEILIEETKKNSV